MTPLAAYVLLFLAVGVGFIFVHLLAGKLIRPNRPDAEKGTAYECGEPTIGTAWVQFDLRFYVVALLFVIFDVEVAFFFPWAEVFGKANALASARKPNDAAQYNAYAGKVLDLAVPGHTSPMPAKVDRFKKMQTMTAEELAAIPETQAALRKKDEAKLTPEDRRLLAEGVLSENEFTQTQEAAHNLAVLALGEIVVFFGVLLVGFAYLWRRGDLQWVRSTAAERADTTAGKAEVAARPRELAGTGS